MKSTFFTLFLLLLFIQTSKAQWYEQTSPVTAAALYSISAADDQNVWVSGESGKVLRTTNGGNTWISVTSPNASLYMFTIWAVDSVTAVVAGANITIGAFVYKTTNGGTTWTQVLTRAHGSINAIAQRVSPDKLLMIGDPVDGRWSVWQSNDYGTTWDTSFSVAETGTEYGLNNALFVHPQLGAWFGTNNTRIYKRIGMTYTVEPTPGLDISAAIWFNDGVNGMAGGLIMLATTDGGGTWATLTAPGTGYITGITGAAADWWYVRYNFIYHTTNNGTTWSTDFTAPEGHYNHMTRSRTGSLMWAIRDNGGISSTHMPIGIQPISNEVPKNFSLSQNYPNPFNPSSIIKFQVAEAEYVRLNVYDVLGRKITNLVDGQLKAGTYEVNFDGSNLPSGIYFYTLVTGDLNHTKKMILLK